jgi:hypothetical protein
LAVFRGLSGVAFLSFRLCRQSSSDFSDFGLPVSTVQIPVPVRSVGSPLISFQMMEEARGGGQLAAELSGTDSRFEAMPDAQFSGERYKLSPGAH